MNASDYSPDWAWISRQIRDQAGNRCEWCGVANGARGARDYTGEWHAEDDIDSMNGTEGEILFGEYPHIIRIVLTVAHLDHDKANNDPANLRALCQRCHLNWDRDRHIAKRQKTAARRRLERTAERGQLTLIETQETHA
ncbi:MAG: hypothetical protein WBA46_01465 [Thermomicrobiales bacterium]